METSINKLYQCPRCTSPDVFAGAERISGTPLVRLFAGCRGCGLFMQNIIQR